jgi:hypothetical protein
MDAIDSIAFLSWSVMLSGLLQIDGMYLIGCQGCWLGTVWIARRLIDKYVDRAV